MSCMLETTDALRTFLEVRLHDILNLTFLLSEIVGTGGNDNMQIMQRKI